MRKVIIYFLMAGMFLLIVFCINGVKVITEQQDTAPEKSQEKPKQYCSHNESTFCSHLPLVLIDTNGQQIEKDREIWSEVTIINNANRNNHIDDKPKATAAATIKYRGSSSYAIFDKMQYRIEFKEEYGDEDNKNISVLGMEPGSDWVINGPFLDRSLVRNRILFEISRKLLPWAPDTRYCEVFVDDDYQGVYLMVEPVTNETGRLNLTDFGLVSGQTAYVLKRDRNDTEENVISTYGSENGLTKKQLSISFPTPGRLTDSQRQWIQNDINEFERVLYSDKFDDPKYGYSAYIDVNSFIDYYIINEFSLTTDAGYLSTYMFKEIGGKIRLTVWDFNNAFNNYMWSVKEYDKFYVAESNYFNRLFQDRAFADAVVKRYKELRNGILSNENLFEVIDNNSSYLGSAIDRNFDIWGYTFYEHLLSKDESGNSRDPESYQEAVEQLKDSIVKRGNFLDDNIQDLYKYCTN